jgi:hypothetical protein
MDTGNLGDGDYILLELPDDDPVFADYDPNDTRGDHGHVFVYVTRWDAERKRPKMGWGHKPPTRPHGNAPYTRRYSRTRRCKRCGVVSSGGMTAADCDDWTGECNSCGAEIDPDAENFGTCDDCRGPLPTADEEMVKDVFYYDRLRRNMKARDKL